MSGEARISTAPASPEAVYVDLDGTLIATDMLWESLVQLLRRDPLAIFRLPVWLAAGRARLKQEVARRVSIDAAHLPYRPEVLDYLAAQRAAGRRIVLATASDEQLARPVEAELGLFDAVLASDGRENRKGAGKLAAIRADAGGADFEYLGNSGADLPIWREARHVTLVAPTGAARRGAAALGAPTRTLLERPKVWPELLRALRPHQWIKNTLLFVPLLLGHEVLDVPRWIDVTVAFLAFCCVASATYLFNDLLDIEADRLHETKRRRPFAAGSLPIPVGIAASLALLALGFGVMAGFVGPAGTLVLAVYAAGTISYSLVFKERATLDVMLLAGLYTHRVLAGLVVAQLPFSPWLLAFSLFFFLSLAYVKRYVELLAVRERNQQRAERRGYHVDDIGMVESLGLTSGYMSILVLCLYISGSEVSLLYAQPALLWLAIPVLLYWLTRVWLLARRGELHDDPVIFATTDATSYLAAALIAGVGIAATLLR